MKTTRKIAVHHLILPEQSLSLTQAVVEIQSGEVCRYYHFDQEQAATEWWGGSIELRHDAEGILRAWRNQQIIE